MKPNNRNIQFIDPEDWQKFAKYLSETNRFILSEYWEDFIQTVVETSHKRAIIIPKDTILVRARIGSEWVTFDDGDEEPCPISPLDMGPPSKDKAIEGRLNPKGIPYLYLSTNKSTAIAEIRPWIKSEITIGHFQIIEDINIVDTSVDEPRTYSKYEIYLDSKKIRPIEYSDAQKEEFIWGDINSAFSRPISPYDSILRYLPTQYLSEKLKIIGYDGIAYRSSLNKDGHNICLFYPNKAKCFRCHMFEIKEIEYKHEPSGNPVTLSDDNKVLYTRITAIRPIDSGKQK